MVQIGTGIVTTRWAVASVIQWSRIILVSCIFNVHYTAISEHLACATRPAWKNTVHHVNSTRTGTNNIIRLANSHQITWFVFWQLIRGKI